MAEDFHGSSRVRDKRSRTVDDQQVVHDRLWEGPAK
jgi:hypothetical protein